MIAELEDTQGTVTQVPRGPRLLTPCRNAKKIARKLSKSQSSLLITLLNSNCKACGGTIRDVPVGRFLVFLMFWSFLVYSLVGRWSWQCAGWSNQCGVMDFAGTTVHTTSGTAVAPRSDDPRLKNRRSQSQAWQYLCRYF